MYFQEISMKTKTSIFAGILFLNLLFAVSSQIFSQIPVPGKIYGENIGKIISRPKYNNPYNPSVLYTSSKSHLYSEPEGVGLIDDFWNSFFMSKVWTAPDGYSIVDYKIKTLNSYDCKFVLLNDASGNAYVVQLLDLHSSYPDSLIAGPIPVDNSATSVTYDGIDGDDLYIKSSNGIYVSRDNALTWQRDTAGLNGKFTYPYAFALDTAQNVYVMYKSGIYSQTPTGNTWKLVNSNIQGANSFCPLYVDRKNRMWLGGSNGVYLSTDGGVTFSSFGNLNFAPRHFSDDIFGNLYATGISPTTNKSVIYRSAGSTGNWKEIDSSLFSNTVQIPNINTIAGDSVLFVGTDFGAFASTDQGKTWIDANNGIKAINLNSLVKQSNGRVFGATSLGIFYKDYSDTVWHKTYPTKGYEGGLNIYRDNTGTLYVPDPALTKDGQNAFSLVKSTDNGKTWNIDSVGLSIIQGNKNFIHFCIDDKGNQYFYNVFGNFGAMTVWKRDFGTINWSADTIGLPPLKNYGAVDAICSDKTNYLYLHLNTNGSNSLMYRRLFTDKFWVLDTVGLKSSITISYLASDVNFGIFSAGSGKLYKRSANGWVNIPVSSKINQIKALSVDSKGTIYLASYDYLNANNTAVYSTKDLGVTWKVEGLNKMTTAGLVSYADTTYALTNGNWGFILTNQSDAGVVDETINSSEKLQVFPNPSETGEWNVIITPDQVGSSLTINDLEGKSVLEIKITDTITRISAPYLPSGMYILTLKNTTGSISTKIVK